MRRQTPRMVILIAAISVSAAFVQSLAGQTDEPNRFAKTPGKASIYSSVPEETGSQAAISAFAGWVGRYLAETDAVARTQLVPEGLTLAKQRRAALGALIQKNPAEALRLSIPLSVRRQIPHDVAAELETAVSGLGDFSVLCADPAPGGPAVEGIQRFVHLDGRTYRAFVYGRRSGETTKNGIPVRGIAIDDL